MKHVGGSVVIWGCMTASGSGAWYRIEGRIDRHMYKFSFRKICCGPLYKITI